MSDLTERLRALANAEHDDLSTADEAADRIEELESTLHEYATDAYKDFFAGMKAAAQSCIEIFEHYESSIDAADRRGKEHHRDDRRHEQPQQSA
jgi:hypothetical protein